MEFVASRPSIPPETKAVQPNNKHFSAQNTWTPSLGSKKE